MNQSSTVKKKRLNSNVDSFFPLEKKVKRRSSKLNLDSLKLDYKFKFEFPRLESYTSEEKIRKRFEALKNFNNDKMDLSVYQNADFYLVISPSYDDLHKAMKYGVFHFRGNSAVNRIFLQNNEENKKTLFYFRVEDDCKISGVAELKSGLVNQKYNFWWEERKNEGVYFLEWIFIKNLDLECFSRTENDRPFSEVADMSLISKDNGFYLLEILKNIPFIPKKSIFKYFLLFDQREDALYNVRVSTDFQIKLQKKEKNFNSDFKNKIHNKRNSYQENKTTLEKGFFNNKNKFRYGKSVTYEDDVYYSKKNYPKDEEFDYIKK